MSGGEMHRTRSLRADVKLEVACEESGRHIFLPAVNLSASGVFLAARERPRLGDSVQLVMSLPPDGEFLRLRAVVVRHSESSEPNGFALCFDGIDERSERMLANYLDS